MMIKMEREDLGMKREKNNFEVELISKRRMKTDIITSTTKKEG